MRPLPPERIDLGDALLRWTTVDDAPAVADATRASFAELQPFMPWAHSLDALTAEASREFARTSTEERAAGKTAAYSLWAADGTCLGGIGLHERIGPGGVEIGYWLRTSATGRGLVTRSAAALTDAALACEDVDHVEIHHDEANERSGAVPRRLGYELLEVRDDEQFAIRSGRLVIWRRTTPIGT